MIQTAALILLVIVCLGLLVVHRSFVKVRTDFTEEVTQTLLGLDHTTHPNWVVCGMMGSGKTTFARAVAMKTGLPHVHIDRFPSKDAVVEAIKNYEDKGWIAEANPWQIPDYVYEQATLIVFLDFDNAVNYVRLFLRYFKVWKEEGFSFSGFKRHIFHKCCMDLGRIVYLHGKANREKWRNQGLTSANVDTSRALLLRCVSPAELELVFGSLTSPFHEKIQNSKKPKIILLAGPAGAGKSSLARRIAENGNWIQLSEDRVWSELNKAPHTPRTSEEMAIVQQKTMAYLLEELEKNNRVVLEFIVYEDPPRPILFYQNALLELGIPYQTRILRPEVEEILRRQSSRGNRHDVEVDIATRTRNAALQVGCLNSELIDPNWVVNSTGLSLEETYLRFFKDILENES